LMFTRLIFCGPTSKFTTDYKQQRQKDKSLKHSSSIIKIDDDTMQSH